MINDEKTCCFIGHRKINETAALKENLTNIVESLINTKNVDTFLFGSKSQFNDVCMDILKKLKIKYPHIKRIYIRAEFPYIDDSYRNYLLQFYEDTYYPEKILNSGKAVYVERNIEMIDRCKYCIIYYDNNYSPTNRNSGTKIAYNYAVQKCKVIINAI